MSNYNKKPTGQTNPWAAQVLVEYGQRVDYHSIPCIDTNTIHSCEMCCDIGFQKPIETMSFLL